MQDVPASVSGLGNQVEVGMMQASLSVQGYAFTKKQMAARTPVSQPQKGWQLDMKV